LCFKDTECVERRFSLGGQNQLFLFLLCLVFSFLSIDFLFTSSSLGSDPEYPKMIEESSDSHEVLDETSVADEGRKTPINLSTKFNRPGNLNNRKQVASSLVSSFGALALVICVFLAFVFITKLFLSKDGRKRSRSFEIVDSCFIDAKSVLMTISWCGKLILVAKTQGRMVPLSELTDRDDVKKRLEMLTAGEEKKDSVHFPRLFGPFASLKRRRS